MQPFGNDNLDKQKAQIFTYGFFGILKGWWDCYLTPASSDEILNAIKMEINQQKEDVVYPLMSLLWAPFKSIF